MTTAKTNRTYMIWIGCNATTGKPNRLTGRLDRYCKEFIAFNSKKERDEFFENYNGNDKIRKCGKSSARQFFLGRTVRQYNELIRDVLAGIC